MNPYSKSISEIFELQKFSIKMGLESITKICDFINNPQNSYPVIHVAGTNGKGSTSRMIQATLSSHGLRVGLYTSPHLVDFRERITIDGKQIEKNYIVEYWEKISPIVYELKSTFFDTTTALAFDYFRFKDIDVAVIETGLGGRLDSTNIVNPVSVVITPIEIDHIKQLGNQLISIAREKSSIIKSGSTVFAAKQKKKVSEVLNKASSQSTIHYNLTDSIKIGKINSGLESLHFNLVDKIRNQKFNQLKLNLTGFYQAQNAGLAYLCSRWYLERSGVLFSEELYRKSLENITWAGRLQLVSNSPLIYFDVSHNYAGFKYTLEFVDQISNSGKRYILLGLLDDKAYKPIIKRVQKSFRNVIITEPNHDRALSAQIIENELQKYGVKPKSCVSIRDAYASIVQNMNKNDVLFVMGSHYIIGELLEFSGKNI